MIFLLITFLFLHIRFQFKINNGFEIYELDYSTNENLQHACDVRLPIILNTPNEYVAIPTTKSKQQLNTNVHIYESNNLHSEPLIIHLNAALDLLHNKQNNTDQNENESDINVDKNARFSFTNESFIKETELDDDFSDNDKLWKPPLTIITEYDYIFGNNSAMIPLQYHIAFRRFICVYSGGSIKLKLTPWKNTKHLNPYYDYKNMQFSSSMTELDTIKFTEIILDSGKMISIPPYYWYSIEFISKGNNSKENDDAGGGDDKIVYCHSYTYKTAFNCLAITPEIAKQFYYNYILSNDK